MSKTNFRKADLKRAGLAAESAGMKIGRIEIDNAGKISLIPGNVPVAAGGGAAANEWDANGAP